MEGGREGGRAERQKKRERERERASRESRYIEREGERREGREGTESSESRENRERGRKREGDDISLNLDVISTYSTMVVCERRFEYRFLWI